MIRDEKVRALAVGTANRAPALPDAPSALQIVPHSDFPIWYGMFAPAKMPREIVDKINRATAKVLRGPEMREKLAKLAVEPMVVTPAEFTTVVNKEIVSGGVPAQAVALKPN